MDVAVSDVAGQLVDYKINKCKMDDENDGQNNNSVASSVNRKSPPIRKIFVGNLSDSLSCHNLLDLFSHYGTVGDVYIPRDQRFGFVTFKYPEDAARVLKLKPRKLGLHLPQERRFHFQNLHVAPADSCHQPLELPDGTVLWWTNSHGGLKRHQHHSVLELDSSESQSRNEASASSESEYAAGDDKEIGAVGGHNLTSQTSSFVRGERKEEGETENDAERGVEEGECKIDILNNDCLIHIFSFLTEIERLKIERVCKRWQMVCFDMWVSQKHTDLFSVFPWKPDPSLNMRVLEAILKRCGRNLHSLDLSERLLKLGASVIQTVAAMCKNLRYLNLSGFVLTSADLRSLSTISHQLIALNLDGCSGMLDIELQDVFIHSPHLESVILSRNRMLSGKCLSGLAHTPLKELVLDECDDLVPWRLVKGLRVLKGLERLSLNRCDHLMCLDVEDIVDALPKLHSLSMAGYFPLFTNTTLTPLDQLCDLISLNLECNPAVNDLIIEAITRSCHRIEELNITGCNVYSENVVHVTDVGLRCLAALPNLVNLTISSAKLSDAALEAIASRGKLRKLVCWGCHSFTDVGCIRVVTSCNELEHFDLSECYLVSNATVQAALDSVKLRTSNIKLTLIVGGTGVCKPDSFEQNPLLEVDSSNLCVIPLQLAYLDHIYGEPDDNFHCGCDYDSECDDCRYRRYDDDPEAYNSVDWDN